jgi:hypothetical protein
MFRITATFQPGYDFETIVFRVRASNAAQAIETVMISLRQLGFKAEQYNLTNSINLEA